MAVDIIIGGRHGRYTVIAEAERHGRARRYLCRCDCGTERVIYRGDLQRPKRTQCIKCAVETHGLSRTNNLTYSSWSAMKERCRNPNNVGYAHYGAVGITVCAEWTDFSRFLADMGERPRGTTLDRIDGTKGYEPGNCRWATSKQQAANRRVTRLLTYAGESLPIAEWARRAGLNESSIANRLKRGWSVERAITTPRTDGPTEVCLRGHPRDAKNVYYRANGLRTCRACGAERARIKARAKRAQENGEALPSPPDQGER